jgi:hypothetical protein
VDIEGGRNKMSINPNAASIHLSNLFNAAYEVAGKPAGINNKEASKDTLNAELQKLVQDITHPPDIADPDVAKTYKQLKVANYFAVSNLMAHFQDIDKQDGSEEGKITIANVMDYKNNNSEDLNTIQEVDRDELGRLTNDPSFVADPNLPYGKLDFQS